MTKRLFILFLALWLPVSVIAAGSMSVAMSGAATQEAAAQAGEGCPQHSGEAIPLGATDDCYGCSFCQFACTAFMASGLQAMSFDRSWFAAPGSSSKTQSFVPEKLQRPPLAS